MNQSKIKNLIWNRMKYLKIYRKLTSSDRNSAIFTTETLIRTRKSSKRSDTRRERKKEQIELRSAETNTMGEWGWAFGNKERGNGRTQKQRGRLLTCTCKRSAHTPSWVAPIRVGFGVGVWVGVGVPSLHSCMFEIWKSKFELKRCVLGKELVKYAWHFTWTTINSRE